MQYIIASGVTVGDQRGELRPDKLNVITGLLLNLYFGFGTLLVYSRLLFLCVFGLFSGDLGC